ncbi:MAG: hypothetical protein ACR2JU_11915 [Nocardioidaceae bacterium]
MSGFEFAAALVGSLAWPIVVLIVAVLFRRQLSALLARPLSSLKAGPLEAVWDRQVAEVEAELPRSPSGATSADGAPDTDRLREIAQAVPAVAVLEAFALIEEQLRQILLDAGVDPGGGGAMQMARRALEAGLVRPEIVKAVEGAAVLRNLAAHGREADLDEARALDYLALVDAVSFALGHQPRPPGATS